MPKQGKLMLAISMFLFVFAVFFYWQNINIKRDIYHQYLLLQQGVHDFLRVGLDQYESGSPEELLWALGSAIRESEVMSALTGNATLLGRHIDIPNGVYQLNREGHILLNNKYSKLKTGENLSYADISELTGYLNKLSKYMSQLAIEQTVKGKTLKTISRKLKEAADKIGYNSY